MFPNPNYHEVVGPGVPWAIRHLPFYGRWFRFLIYHPGCDGGLETAKVDPDWEPQERSVSELNDITREIFTEWITSQVGDDPELVEKVVPTYPPTGKRTLQDNGTWLRTLTRPDVELVRAGVESLEGDTVVDSDGGAHRADVLIWATGFRPNEFLLPMEIRGRDGVDLREWWGTRPRAYMGVTVTGFPNLFLMYGPGTNLASGGSIIAASECEMTYVDACLRLLVESCSRTIEPTTEAFDAWYEKCQEEVRGTVWASPHIEHSFYKNADGEVHGLNPFRFVDYWAWTRSLDLDDHVLG
jgi:4-hydroxyacetophenone monooxygenase